MKLGVTPGGGICAGPFKACASCAGVSFDGSNDDMMKPAKHEKRADLNVFKCTIWWTNVGGYIWQQTVNSTCTSNRRGTLELVGEGLPR